VDGKFAYVNQAYAVMLGYQSRELIGKTWRDVTFPQEQLALAQSFARRLAGETAPTRPACAAPTAAPSTP
jgi:PAS domain S-box-containing protein